MILGSEKCCGEEPETPQAALKELPLYGPYQFYQIISFNPQDASYIKACAVAMQKLEERHNGAYARAFKRCPELKAVMQEGMNALICAFVQKNNDSLTAPTRGKPGKIAAFYKISDDRIRVVIYQFEERLNQFLDQFGAALEKQHFRIKHLMDPAAMLGAPIECCMRSAVEIYTVSSGVPRDYSNTAPPLLEEMGFQPTRRNSSIPHITAIQTYPKKERWTKRCKRNEYPPAWSKE